MNVIKLSQYNNCHQGPSSSSVSNQNSQIIKEQPSKIEEVIPIADNVELSIEYDESLGETGVLNTAFEKAKKIVEAANNYSENYIKEATERMNKECVSEKQKSHDEAYNSGIVQGKSEGREIGYKEGYQTGYNEGLKKAKEENLETISNLYSIINELSNAKNSVIEKEENSLSDLAIFIAETVINQKLSEDKTQIKSVIDGLVQKNQDQEWIKVHVSDKVYEELEKLNYMESIKQKSKNVKLFSSRDLTDSDCVVELPSEVIDASVSTQFSKIKTILKK